MQCPSCNAEVRIGSIHCHFCGEPLENIFRQDIENTTLPQDIPADDEYTIPEVPQCYRCGRQDDTLRIVVYPFVVSFVVVTFRRAFVGLMCKRHRNLYLVLASGITATIGWIGIPFGIIFAPIALFQLARGGIQPQDENIQMLKSLAKYKYSLGDTAGAMRCLEACLQFGDNDEIQREIQQFRRRLIAPKEETELQTKVSSTIALLIGSALIGTVIGFLDSAVTEVFSFVLQGEIFVYLAILTWSPFIAMTFIGGLALYQLIEWVITRTSLLIRVIAVSLSGLSALVAVYSIEQGKAIFYFVYGLLLGGVFGSVYEAIFYMITGGFWMFIADIEELSSVNTSNVIYLVLLVITLSYYLFMAIRIATKTVQWQKRIIITDHVLFD